MICTLVPTPELEWPLSNQFSPVVMNQDPSQYSLPPQPLSQEHPGLYRYALLVPELRMTVEVNTTLNWARIFHALTEFFGYLI